MRSLSKRLRERTDPVAQKLQQMAYQASPYLVFAYPYRLEAYRSDRWTGVVTSPSNVPGYEGSAFYNYGTSTRTASYNLWQPPARPAAAAMRFSSS